MAEKYQSVNGAWPEGTRDGRDLKPTPDEAMAAARRLYKFATTLDPGKLKPFTGKMRLTSGNRYTWIRGGVFNVNPDQRGGGWHELVHAISHQVTRRMYGENHGGRHAFIERELIAHVVKSGWLDGKLRREPKAKPPVDVKAKRYARVVAGIARWQAKQRRATTALRKLNRQRAYYERQQSA